MRLKIATVALALALAGVTAFLVWAQIAQEDTSTGRVTVTGDFLEVSPEVDWLTVESFGGSETSGIQELRFTNLTTRTAVLQSLLSIDMVVNGPDPNVFDGTLTFTLGVADPVLGCLVSTLTVVPLTPGFLLLNQAIPAGEYVRLCGELVYDGSLEGVNDWIDFYFTFDSDLLP